MRIREQAVLTGSPYDAIAYPGHPYAQTHPDRLATIATLFGLAPAPPDDCRVLELGCGDAGNLVPMALGLPGARFVGIDAAPRAIDRARRLTDALGLRNVELIAARIEDYEPPENGFDYVIVHGVYSWVPAAVRDRLLATCRTALAADGVAYVSYNALPGGRLREALRDMLVFHTGGLDDPRERVAQARELLQFLLAGWADQPFAAAMRGYVERLVGSDDALLAHDELADDNASVYFHEFAAHAARQGLQYLAEADFFEMQTGVMPDAVSDALREVGDVVRREQYLDFLKGRMFRQTLLCRAEARIDRRPRPAVIEHLAVSSPARASGDPEGGEQVTFEGPAGATLTTDHPLVARALGRVCERWPAAVPVRELLAGETQEHDRSAICDALLRAYGANLVQLHVCPPSLSVSPGERPETSPLARHQARDGPVVTNLRHASVRIEDDLGRRLVVLLDGRRDRAQLAAELRAFLSGTGAPVPDDLEDGLERSLRGLATLALLTPPGG